MSPPVLAWRSSRANAARIGSACAANRDSQPRTVDAGRPAAARSPATPARPRGPAAPPRSPPPHPPAGPGRTGVTARGSGRSRRRSNRSPAAAGSAEPAPRLTRTNRGAACPHGASRCPHAGHVNAPDNRRRSTTTGSGPTLSNRPPPGAFERPFPAAGQREREGPLAFKITRNLSGLGPHPDATHQPDRRAPKTSSPPKTRQDPRPPHPKRRSTHAHAHAHTHTHTHTADVDLTGHPQWLTLDIRDDGPGLRHNPPQRPDQPAPPRPTPRRNPHPHPHVRCPELLGLEIH